MKRMTSFFLRKPAPIGLGLTSLHVLDEPLIVALPNNHPLTEHPDAIQLLDLEPYDFVLYRRLAGQDLFDNILASCYQAGFSPKIVQGSSTFNVEFKFDCSRDWFVDCSRGHSRFLEQANYLQSA